MASAAPEVLAARVLRQARLERGESLERAASRTHIHLQYLEALENDAPLRAFPSGTYARLFLRTYARYLDLDDERLVEAFASRHGADPSPEPALPPMTKARSRSAMARAAARDGSGIVPMKRTPIRIRIRISRVSSRAAKLVPKARSQRQLEPGWVAAGVAVGVAVLLVASVVTLATHRSGPKVRHLAATSPAPTVATLPDGTRTVLPGHRVVAFYGQPPTDALGVLGAGSPDQAAAHLLQQTEQYQGAGDVMVMPAFELIATVATDVPGPDGEYRRRSDAATIQSYLDAVRRIHGLLVLDIQPGRADFMTEVKQYEAFLRQPDVGLALDGEWHVGPGEVPGVVIGSIDGQTVNQISAWLSAIVRRQNLPQKLFIIHQFTPQEIHDRGIIVTDRPGLATVLDIDGYGTQGTKTQKYDLLTRRSGAYFHGFKVYYKQDPGLMDPLAILGLRPTPDVVIYQ